MRRKLHDYEGCGPQNQSNIHLLCLSPVSVSQADAPGNGIVHFQSSMTLFIYPFQIFFLRGAVFLPPSWLIAICCITMLRVSITFPQKEKDDLGCALEWQGCNVLSRKVAFVKTILSPFFSWAR